MPSCASSSSAAISGLGISFIPDPPIVHRAIRHTVSYDVGLNRVQWDRHHRRDSKDMVRIQSDDSAHQGVRRVRIAEGEPQVFGGGFNKQQHHHQHRQDLSPFSSDFDTTSSPDSGNDFSPTSMSSLPSSHGSESAYDPYHSRLAKSMGALRYQEGGIPLAPPVETAQSRPYPRPIDVTIPIHHEHNSGLIVEQQPTPSPPTPSRLPAFLQQRNRSHRFAAALTRPQSMYELAQLHASQAIDYRPHIPQESDLSTRYRPPSSYTYSSPPEDDGSYNSGGLESPESIPSSAGGLQRRYLERQYERHGQLEREKQRREREEAVEVQEQSEDLQTVSTSEKQDDIRARSRSRSQSGGVKFAAMRPMASRKGLEAAQNGAGFAEGDVLGKSLSEEERVHNQSSTDGMVPGEGTVILDEDADNETAASMPMRRGSVFSSISSSQQSSGGLSRQSTLLTAGANPVRRSKELDRLLAPSNLKKSSSTLLAPIVQSPTFSASDASASASASSAVPSSSRQRAASQVSSRPTNLPAIGVSPVVLEQAKSSSKARVELDLVLESALVVEGGSLRGRVEIRVRKPKDREREVWLTKPKIRVVGFEELLSHDARHIFYHHASVVSALDSPAGPPSPLPCFDSAADPEGYQKGKAGHHVVPFSMRLPIGKGAKGGWKGKQGVVRYIVIASIKLKSEKGGDRSIAHFYRHVEIFPYFNPALILAPALKPLSAIASKSLFLGGSGKVELSARIHRATWVAGQRCYVDINVDNQSTKKIKTLTLSLIRTTTVFRPRPWLTTGNGHDSSALGELHVDVDACQTQTTKKKVAEATLEMGKRVNKGVTAKGSWMGVEAHESGDFSHYLLVPTDALSMIRGRYLEVTYELKISVGGSLSADVTADIPIRVVNFVSLDPPPGHVVEPISVASFSHSLAKSWSIDQLRPEIKTRTAAIREEGTQLMARMASLDSLRLSDLNGGRGPSRAGAPTLSRVGSLDSLRTEDLSRAGSTSVPMTRGSTVPYLSEPETLDVGRQKGDAVVGRAKERQLNHQMSLDCISSAIASATARRQQGHQRSESALRAEILPMSAPVEQWDPDVEDESVPPFQDHAHYYGGGGERLYDHSFGLYGDTQYEAEGSRLQLDDLDDVPDDPEYTSPPQHTSRHNLDIGNESEDELDAVLGQSQLDEDDEEFNHAQQLVTTTRRPASTTFARSLTFSATPSRSQPSSSIKPSSEVPKSAMKPPPAPFAFATPSSPVRASFSIDTPPSAGHRCQPLVTDLPKSTRGPLPARPSAARPSTSPMPKLVVKEATPASPVSRTLKKQTSTSSLKRSSAVIIKRPSTRSMQGKVSPTFSAHSEPSDAPDLDSSSAKSSPEMDGAKTPPVLSPPVVATTETERRPSFQSSSVLPRKVRSPTLVSTRSKPDLRRAAVTSAPKRAAVVLPSVRSKVAALESRQQALDRLSGKPTSRIMERNNSVTDSESSFLLDNIGQANSITSFQAPLFRRQHKEV